jgi:hypothetical protein
VQQRELVFVVFVCGISAAVGFVALLGLMWHLNAQ